jgi:hypothetical protein
MKLKTNCTVFVVLYETNILNLINQCLDNYYQIKTKMLQYSTVHSGGADSGI